MSFFSKFFKIVNNPKKLSSKDRGKDTVIFKIDFLEQGISQGKKVRRKKIERILGMRIKGKL